MHHAPQVHVDHLAPVIERDVELFAEHADARVVEQEIDAAVLAHRAVNQLLHRIGIGHIHGGATRLTTRGRNRARHLVRTRGVAVGHHDARPAPCQRFAQRLADSRCPARHDRHGPRKRAHLHTSSRSSTARLAGSYVSDVGT